MWTCFTISWQICLHFDACCWLCNALFKIKAALRRCESFSGLVDYLFLLTCCCKRKGKNLTERCWSAVTNVPYSRIEYSVGAYSSSICRVRTHFSCPLGKNLIYILQKCDIISVYQSHHLFFSSFPLEPEAKLVLAKKGDADMIHHYLSKTILWHSNWNHFSSCLVLSPRG